MKRKDVLVTESIAGKEVCSLCLTPLVQGQLVSYAWNAYEFRNRYSHKTCPVYSANSDEEAIEDIIRSERDASIRRDEEGPC